jgi:hypothetical protein
VDRELGIGTGRADLLVRWPLPPTPNDPHREQREVVEIKVWRPRKPDPLAEGLAQLDRYIDRLGLDTGTLLVFDRRPASPPIAERTALSQTTSPAGHQVALLRA